MPGHWQGSTRAQRLPNDWPARRARVKARAHGRCQALGCTAPGTECDHINPGDDHSLANLQWLCHTHHAAKTKTEAAAGYAAHSPRRPTPRHPGNPST